MTRIANNQRTQARHPRRFKVVVGPMTLFTHDVGSGGLCLETMTLPARHSVIQAQVIVSGTPHAFEGTVAWVMPGDTRVGDKGRCGVRFTKASTQLTDALKALKHEVAVPSSLPIGWQLQQSEPTAAVLTAPDIVQEGETWLVRVPARFGRQQVYRCPKESLARRLFDRLQRAA